MVLLLDIVHTLISRSILISSLSSKEKAKASLAVFIIVGILYLIVSIIYTLRNAKQNYSKGTWIVDIVHLLGGLVYFVGDNYPPLVRSYGSELGCGQACMDMVTASEPVLLGMAVVFYRLLPFCIGKYFRAKLAKKKKTTEIPVQFEPEWILAAESLTLLVEFDSWFTVVGTAPSFSTPVGNTTICPTNAYTAATWAFWVFYVLMYMFILHFVLHIQYDLSMNANVSCVTTNFGTIGLWGTLALYLLADNTLPLSCTGALNGREYEDSVTRVVMLVLVLIPVSLAIILLLVYRCLPKNRQEALYKHLNVHSDDDGQELKKIRHETNGEEKK